MNWGKRRFGAAVALLLAASAVDSAGVEVAGDINSLLKPIRDKYGLPSLAGAVTSSDGLIAAGAQGVRSAWVFWVPVQNSDKYHLGSTTKPMTATLAARMIDLGIFNLRWNSTMPELFPDLASRMHPDFRSVTLAQALAHQGGFPPLFDGIKVIPSPRVDRITALAGTDVEKRQWLAEEVLTQKPLVTPGTESYSNEGMIIAGSALERILRVPWEIGIRAFVYYPLQMSSCGFGAPNTPGVLDQPVGHLSYFGFRIPVEADNASWFGPSGTAHCSIEDWSKFARAHLKAARGSRDFLSPESSRMMHYRMGTHYSAGWYVYGYTSDGLPILTFAGTNTKFYAQVYIMASYDRAYLVATNAGDDLTGPTTLSASNAITETGQALVQAFPWP